MRNAEKDAKEMTARRELMLQKGFKIFSEQVIEAVSMQEVANACNIGIATLYRYFPTKLEFVIAIGTRKWKDYYLEVEELYKDFGGEKMNAAQEFNFYLEAYVTLYKNHKDILRFNKNFDTYVRHEGATAKQMKPYNEAVNVFAKKFHVLFMKAKKDGTLRTDISEKKLFISSMYTMLPVAAKYAEGLIYPDEIDRDMAEELIALKNMILNAYVAEEGRKFLS